jgi:hypothetical protein
MVAARLIKKTDEETGKDRYELISYLYPHASGCKPAMPCGSQTGSYRCAQSIGADTNVNDFKAIETLRRMRQCDNRGRKLKTERQ